MPAIPTSTTWEPGMGCSISPPMVAKKTPTRRQSCASIASGGGSTWAMTMYIPASANSR